MIRKTEEGNFTLKQEIDGKETKPTRPPKFSYPDKYGEYRRKTKKEAENNS